MNLSTLLQQYAETPSLSQLVNAFVAPKPQHILLKNLSGSSISFVLQAVVKNTGAVPRNHLVIVDDAEEAAYLCNTLEGVLANNKNICYFPASFKTKKNYSLINDSHVVLRTEALATLSQGEKQKIIITYPEALFEKVVAQHTLQRNSVMLKINDQINIAQLFETLTTLKFIRTDFVYEPGQFAMRGGIIDIYSFGNEQPYRIELLGNEIASIRIFNPETQLSDKKILQVNILPNMLAQTTASEKINFFEFLSTDTIVWCKDWLLLEEKLHIQTTDFENWLANTTQVIADKYVDSGLSIQLTKNDIIDVSNLHTEMLLYYTIEFGKSASIATTTQEIIFNTQPQPSFNRQFKLLIEDLKAKEAMGYSLYIFAEQPNQLERLKNIFSDLKSTIHFTPIATSIHEGFIDNNLKVVCYTDHQIFQRYHKYKVKQVYSKSKAFTIKSLQNFEQGDYITHIDHGVGRYSGLQKIKVNGILQEVVRIIYRDEDILYVNINSLHKISKYTGKEGTPPRINKLGSEVWNKLKEKTKIKVKEIAFDLISLYAQRKAEKGFAHAPDNYMQTELEASFIYEDTPDQNKATLDVKKDMESESPMDRLVCGDVGFGKTEIAIRAAFKTCCDGRQAVVLVPTTILAFQHFKTFQERLKDFPVTVDYINRFRSIKEKKEVLEKLAAGNVDIIIGTHGLLSNDVKFKNLGLIVVDEEQKFGVGHKEKLKTLKTNVDSLTLTATPIPRTLQFSLMGARDLSIINTAPPNRQPIQTEVKVLNEDHIREALYYEVERGGQVFFIHNRIQGLQEITALLQNLCPDISIGFAHGQMEGHDLEQRVLDFIDKKYDVLVSTNIVESGVDIPNANTIIVNNAHQFGLSDLHQLRGRVGRSNKKAFCYLLAPPISTLPDDSRKRLQTLEQLSDLGSGFQIAMRDLDIRGAGDMLGGEQSGFITDIGFETYQKILDEAIRELKRSSFVATFREEIVKQDDFVSDCIIDTDLAILIPDDYVDSVTERLSLYTRLNNCKSEESLVLFTNELKDRFGQLPTQVQDLFTTIRCRWLGIVIGFEKMTLKQNVLRCYFINRPDSPYFESQLFQNILKYIQTETAKAQLKEVGKNFMLVVHDINSTNDLYSFLSKMKKVVVMS